MELNGADAASRDFDELFAPKADGSFGRRPGLHDEVLREMEPHPIAASTDFAQKTAVYLELGLPGSNATAPKPASWFLRSK